MQYEDRVSISTPEGIEIDLALAGLGSRLSARLIDFLLQLVLAGIVLLIVGLILTGISGSTELGFGAGAGFAFFAMLFYDALYEAYREGQTPGKKRLGIRVLGDGGEPVSFRAALVRNVMRLIDEVFTLFLGALVSIVRSPRNQRLGDMAAGTIVVGVGGAEAGEEISSTALGSELTVSLGAIPILERAGTWDTSAVTTGELDAIRHYLGRRGSLNPEARAELGARLADGLRERVVGAEPGIPDEWLLEVVAALRSSH
jgi:uncharacterized RDD family membrane protein YckC